MFKFERISGSWRRLTMVFLVLLIGSCKPREVRLPAPIGPVPSEAQLAWHEMETNIFVHFTINTFTDKEWGYGDESSLLFNPGQTDVDQWVSTFKETGFKGVILTTKHHDGFCLWPSKYTEHSIKNSPYKNGNGDLVKEVSDACKRHGLKFGIYMSPWDRNRADYGKPAYVEYYRNQLQELFASYGPVFEMWFDGANGGDGFYGGARETRKIDGSTYYNWPATLDLVRKSQPDVIFFSDAGPGVRWVGNEKGIAGETNWNTITRDTLYAGKAGIETLLSTGSENGTHWIPAEVDVSIRPGWFYHEGENDKVKSPQDLFEIYLSSVGRGSTLLLNVPPDKNGLLHPHDVESLRGLRKLLDKTFKHNLAGGANVKASSVRGNVSVFDGANAVDDNPESYWATDDDVTTGSLELQLEKQDTLHYAVLQEYIRLGQRVRQFKIEAWVGEWKEVARGTTIGYKRIIPIDPTKTDRVRVTISSSKACPLISTVSLF
jgi:alpha-L-fucosidase